jgi:3'-phosphoadenosine 5'-phosphosulfate sulfotransferase (PAPS reductase)/FAD synthetase
MRQLTFRSTTPTLDSQVDEALTIIDAASDIFCPSTRYVCFSGGYDSLVTTHLCMEHFDFDAVLHIDTGIGVETTRHFVESVCDQYGWPLKVIAAPDCDDPQRYEDLIIPPEVRSGDLTWLERGGFPGPTDFGHGKMFDRLKGRPIEQAVRTAKQPVSGAPSYAPTDAWLARRSWSLDELTCTREQAHQLRNTIGDELEYRAGGRTARQDRILLVTGVYADESQRRAPLRTRMPWNRDGSTLWVNPCLHWTSDNMDAYRESRDLRAENPVYATLGMSGECLCGAFAKPHERQRIRACDRSMYDRICELERKAHSHGYCWDYEEGPPERVIEAKQMLRKNDNDQVELDLTGDQLCSNCGAGFWEQRQNDLSHFRRIWGTDDVGHCVTSALDTIAQRTD